ncbi:MAG: hypothetical protein AAF657_14570 [Acidobacteriota bacterium]
MRIRSAGVTALTPLLLLISLLDASGHELLCRDEPAPPGIAADGPSSGALTAPDLEEQDHDCLCCGVCGPRVSLAPPSATDSALAAVEVTPARRGALFVEPFPASYPGRGPPVG